MENHSKYFYTLYLNIRTAYTKKEKEINSIFLVVILSLFYFACSSEPKKLSVENVDKTHKQSESEKFHRVWLPEKYLLKLNPKDELELDSYKKYLEARAVSSKDIHRTDPEYGKIEWRAFDVKGNGQIYMFCISSWRENVSESTQA